MVCTQKLLPPPPQYTLESPVNGVCKFFVKLTELTEKQKIKHKVVQAHIGMCAYLCVYCAQTQRENVVPFFQLIVCLPLASYSCTFKG